MKPKLVGLLLRVNEVSKKPIETMQKKIASDFKQLQKMQCEFTKLTSQISFKRHHCIDGKIGIKEATHSIYEQSQSVQKIWENLKRTLVFERYPQLNQYRYAQDILKFFREDLRERKKEDDLVLELKLYEIIGSDEDQITQILQSMIKMKPMTGKRKLED